MTESILIEVDEMTRGIMERVQSEMYEGNRGAFEHMKDDMIAAVESVQRAMKQMELNLQRLTRDSEEQSEEMKREMSQLQQSIVGMPLSLRGEFDAMSKVLLQQAALMDGRYEQMSSKVLDEINRQLNQQSEQQSQTQELLLAKLQKLEEEVQWNNTPLLKKWFGGRKKRYED